MASIFPDADAINTDGFGLDLESQNLARLVGNSYIQFGRFRESVGFDKAELDPPSGMKVIELFGSLQYVSRNANVCVMARALAWVPKDSVPAFLQHLSRLSNPEMSS